ncbi:MAG: cell division protein ZipA C-terminal FtsZ-binding domain-containing protein [Burkholderiaceae bacterium]|nr:cell division protein ZipA C-terminal FtsZ-binding domain-containing protein [Burkholderiaceae bacterium]
MSSLAVSLLLLVVVAIAIAVAYNLRQGAWPRWEQALRRMLSRERASGKAQRSEPPARREAAAGNGRRSAERGEPRLDAGLRSDARAAFPADERAESTSVSLSDGSSDEPGEVPVADRATAHSLDRTGESAPEERAVGRREERIPGTADVAASEAPGVYSTVVAAAAAAAPEASLSPAPEPLVASSAAGAAEHGGREAAATDATASTPPAAAAAGAGPALSEACDCIIELAPASRLAGERLLAVAQRLRRAGSKPVAFDARTGSDDGFAPPTAGRNYDFVRVGVLMANRNGPLNAMEFSEFVSAVQAIAETLPARAEAPAMGSVLARARDLDSTCAQLDVQIGVNVEAPEAVDPAQLAALAPALSLVERGSHRYVRPGPQGEPLFTLGFSDSPSRLTFVLDVPRVAASLEPFARMVQTAGACAQRLGARLVDDSGKPLTQASLGQIARQLAQRYESLEAIGLPAGSSLACKVFN